MFEHLTHAQVLDSGRIAMATPSVARAEVVSGPWWALVNPVQQQNGRFQRLAAYFFVKIWSKLAPSAKCALSAVAQPPKALSIVNRLSLGSCLAYLACALADVGR